MRYFAHEGCSTTEPSALHAFRKAQLAGDASARAAAAVRVTDDELRATVEDGRIVVEPDTARLAQMSA